MFAQQLDKLGETPFFIRAQMIMNVPAEIILAEIQVVFAAALNYVVECVHAEIARFAKLAPKLEMIDPPAQSPNRINKGKMGQLRPRFAKIKNLMLRRR